MRSIVESWVAGICRILRSTRRRWDAPEPPSAILLTMYTMPLGCCVHATPVLEGLRRSFPGITIVVATRGMGAAVLRDHPAVDLLLCTKNDPTQSWSALLRTVREIRRALQADGLSPELLLQDASQRRGSFGLLAALLRLPSIGFADAPALLDHHLAYDRGRSLIANNLRLVEALGPPQPAFRQQPSVYFDPAALARAHALVGGSGATRIAVVMRGSGGQRTAWHAERFGAVLRPLEATGAEVLLLGATADREPLDRWRQAFGVQAANLAGETSIAELAALLCLCDLMITIDTGTLHVGRACGLPMVVLAPSWQSPVEWLPLGVENVRILRGADRTTVPEDYRLDEIEVDAVLEAARELLRLYPPSLEGREERIARRLNSSR